MSYDLLKYNDVRQKSAHNCFQKREGVVDQIVYWRLRSLELDLHRKKAEHPPLDHDWWIYHESWDPDTTVERLSGFLTLFGAIHHANPQHEVITLFLDMKEAFDAPSGAQSGAALDVLLRRHLAGSMFTPADLLDWAQTQAPGSPLTSLKAAITRAGWPTLAELRGKFVVVLTGKAATLNTYLAGSSPDQRAAFLSAGATKVSDVDNAPAHVLFFNMDAFKIVKELGEHRLIQVAERVNQLRLVSRAYYVDLRNTWETVVRARCHHIATDCVNSRVTKWASTAQVTGYPFQALAGSPLSAPEAGDVCGVWALSCDQWGKEDSCYFHYATLGASPDNVYTFLISGANSHLDDWAKGGVVARASLAGGSAYFGVFRVGQNHPLRVQYRTADGGTTVAALMRPVAGLDADTLAFVRLDISEGGTRATAFGSHDGWTWQLIASHKFDIPLAYQGLAVSARDDSKGVKFLFAVPAHADRPALETSRLIGPHGPKYGGGRDWDAEVRWKVDRWSGV
jgi:hypothetical protein